MKKILLSMLPMLAMSLTSCEKNNENNGELSGDDVIEFEDANFLKALLTVKEIVIYDAYGDYVDDYLVDVDVNKDGAITVKEAQAVIGLDLSGCYISEMPEIKYFTRLVYLECNGNQLTSLDVSYNTALEYLNCCYNQLTSLDLSKNAALEYLDCSDNQLTSLDLSKNAALIDLYCADNQLTSLDVSNNTALTGLNCIGNQLTSLDVSNNTAFIGLFCGSNQLTSLDVHNNRELLYLECSNNPLQELILYRYHELDNYYMSNLESEYGDIIEYME